MWRSPGLAGWLHWFEHSPIHQKVVGSIPGQGTYLGCGFHPHSGHIQEATNQCFFLPLFLSLSLSPLLFSQRSINITSGEDFLLSLKKKECGRALSIKCILFPSFPILLTIPFIYSCSIIFISLISGF